MLLYEGNQAVIAMINQQKPPSFSRHIDVQFFAIQEWHTSVPGLMA